MKFAIRVDDIGWSTNETTYPIKESDVGLKIAQQFHNAMCGTPYLGAVIAGCVDDAGLKWLRSNPDGMTVAVHGWDHGASRPHERDEFSSLSTKKIRDRIELAQRRLGKSAHMVPPYNAMSQLMLESVYFEGIRYLWVGDRDWPTPPMPYEQNRLWIIPSWRQLYGGSTFRQGESPIIIDSVNDYIKIPGVAVIVLHITWEKSHHDDFAGIRKLVDRLHGHVISPDQYVRECCK